MQPISVINKIAESLRGLPKVLTKLETHLSAAGRNRAVQKAQFVARLEQVKSARLGQLNLFHPMFWYSQRPSYKWAVCRATHNSRRYYLTNPFNPFHKGHFFSSTYFRFLRASHLSRLNPMHPLNRYSIHHWFFRYRMNSIRYQSPIMKSFWRLPPFATARFQGPRFFLFLSFYYGVAPQAHGRLFTTYACGGPIPNFAFLTQMTTEAIKNIAISVRTILNLDKSIKPVPSSDNTNNFKVYPNQKLKLSEVKLIIRLNKSLQPSHTKTTLEIGLDEEDTCESHEHQQVMASGCYVDFALGDQLLSIPSMTFLTEEILSEINANLSYILRRIEELRADFQGLSELGELPIKYLPKENTLRVYFHNCDRDKLEMLLREKNITGGIIHEDESAKPDCIGGDVETILLNTRAMPPPALLVVGNMTEITEHDLLSTMYQSGNTGLSEELSLLYDDDLLSLSGLLNSHNQCQNPGNHHHPLMDAEVIRLEEMDFERGPITISDSSVDYFTFGRPRDGFS